MAARCARAALALLLPLAFADVIFRVPEVMVRHAANTKAVGTGRANASRNDTDAEAYEGLLEVRYEEYFVEHEISTVDARKAAVALDLDKIPETLPGCGTCSKRELQYCETRVLADHCCCERQAFPEPFPGCRTLATWARGAASPSSTTAPSTRGYGIAAAIGSWRRDVAVPALSASCSILTDRSCERQAFPEPYPWLPYTCYMGPGRCKPLVHDCAKYKRIRDCCCYRKLAERWKHILASSGRAGVSGASLLLLSMLLFVAYL